MVNFYVSEHSRGFSAAETACRWCSHAGVLVASMEPRLFGRGYEFPDVEGNFEPPASMEPRLFGRGYRVRPPVSSAKRLLQWSRGFSAADTSRSSLSRTKAMMLQWSRGFSAADTPLPGVLMHPAEQSFNGAAAFRPRIRTLRSVRSPSGRSFNGAAAFRPRIPWQVELVVITR